MLIRKSIPSDEPALLALFLIYQQAIASFTTHPSAEPASFEKQTDGELILVAFDDKELIGFISIWQPDHFIHHLYVSPNCRRNGVAAALLQAAIQATGLPIRLKCLEANETALQFYKSKDFTCIEKGNCMPEGNYLVLQLSA